MLLEHACVDPPHRLVCFQNDFRTYNLGSPTAPVNLNEDTARDRVREVEGDFLATVTLHHAVLQRLRPMRACTQVSPPSSSTPSPTRSEDGLFIRHVVVELLTPIPRPASQSRPVPMPSENRHHVPPVSAFLAPMSTVRITDLTVWVLTYYMNRWTEGCVGLSGYSTNGHQIRRYAHDPSQSSALSPLYLGRRCARVFPVDNSFDSRPLRNGLRAIRHVCFAIVTKRSP